MSNEDENQELQLYLKNAFKKEIDPNTDEDDDDIDAGIAEEIQYDSVTAANGILVYSDNMQQQHASSSKPTNKIVKMKLNQNTGNVLNVNGELPNENQTAGNDGFKVFDYNETVVLEDDPETELLVPKETVHIVTDEKAEETLSCPKCTYTTNKRFLLTRHLKNHSDERPFKCSVCDRGFKSNAALMNHVNMHLGKKPHHCKDCEMRFNTGGELARHVRYKHTLEKPHKCAECDYSSVELSKMRRHMRMHTGERPYQCPHCTYASPDTFKLKRHLRTHTGEKPYECDICLARFTQSNSLKSHKLIHSVGERPVFQCTLCPTTCGRKTDLQLHIQKLHTSDHPIKCKRCGKELPDRYTYKMHVKTHEGEKCYRCNICPYASISQRHLDMHILVHTDEKPFVCDQCEQSFRHRQLLQRHVNIYHNKNYVPPTPLAKNHICPHCRRAFLRKGNLMRHMEIHDAKLANHDQKAKLKMGRQIRTTDGAGITMHIQSNNDNSFNDGIDHSENGVEKFEYYDDDYDDDDDEEDCKFVDTFELVDDFIDESIEAKEDAVKSSFTYRSAASAMNKIATTSTAALRSPTILEISTRPSNIFILPSGATEVASTSIKKEQRLPIKIDLGMQDVIDTESGNENIVVIEVIEEDVMADDGEENSMIAGDTLEIPFQNGPKEEYDFADNNEYVLAVEVADEDS